MGLRLCLTIRGLREMRESFRMQNELLSRRFHPAPNRSAAHTRQLGDRLSEEAEQPITFPIPRSDFERDRVNDLDRRFEDMYSRLVGCAISTGSVSGGDAPGGVIQVNIYFRSDLGRIPATSWKLVLALLAKTICMAKDWIGGVLRSAGGSGAAGRRCPLSLSIILSAVQPISIPTIGHLILLLAIRVTVTTGSWAPKANIRPNTRRRRRWNGRFRVLISNLIHGVMTGHV